MPRLATREDFEEGGLYTSYQRFPFFAQRADELRGRYANTNTSVLVAGCGWGFLVDELRSRGYGTTWGCDASQYAIDKAHEVLSPSVASQIVLADCRSQSDMNAVRSAALRGNQRFNVVITEDFLGCLDSIADVQLCLTVLRGIGSTLFHIITCLQPTEPSDQTHLPPEDRVFHHRDNTLLWRTQDEWKAIIGNNELVADVESQEIR